MGRPTEMRGASLTEMRAPGRLTGMRGASMAEMLRASPDRDAARVA